MTAPHSTTRASRLSPTAKRKLRREKAAERYAHSQSGPVVSHLPNARCHCGEWLYPNLTHSCRCGCDGWS